MNLQLKGNINQFTTTGKNLLQPRPASTTKNGITISYDASTQIYTFNGTCDTDNTLFRYADNDINFISGTTTSITY